MEGLNSDGSESRSCCEFRFGKAQDQFGTAAGTWLPHAWTRSADRGLNGRRRIRTIPGIVRRHPSSLRPTSVSAVGRNPASKQRMSFLARQTSHCRLWVVRSQRPLGSFARLTGTLAISALSCLVGSHVAIARAAQQEPPPRTAPGRGAEGSSPAAKPAAPSADPARSDEDTGVQPGDWAPELLDAILTSTNSTAPDALYEATFAAGPDVIPQLQAALRDDRTAEFAAQSLAYLGGQEAFKILATLISDRRNLDLRRFFLGSLGEYHTPEVTRLLLNAVEKSDQEPDRTVTEAAIWALTVRSDQSLVPELREAESKIQDFVIRDDVDNALQVIDTRARYLASPEGKKVGGSIPEAVRSYFIAALESSTSPTPKPAVGSTAKPTPPPPPKAEVQRVIFTPDHTRALAHVVFEDPSAAANYNIVLQKQLGDWVVASVWVMSQTEKPEPRAVTPKASR